jgi:hypothetical protein
VNQITCAVALVSILALQRCGETATAGPQTAAPSPDPRPTPTQPATSVPILGDCNRVPNYSTSTLPGMPGGEPGRFRRWRSFPITYSVDTSGLPVSVQKLYEDAGVMARDLWSIATAGRVAQLRQLARGGQISVRFVPRDSIPSPGVTTIAGRGDVITSAAVQMARFPDDVALVERGLQRRVVLQTVNTLAHELGHALGVQLHSPDEADLMNEFGNFLPVRDDARDPQSFVTAADRNTMLHAYCR